MLKAVLFDIDNTLYSYAPCDKAGTEAMQTAFDRICPGRTAAFPTLLAQAKQEVKRHTAGTAACHNRLLYAQRLCEAAGRFTAAHVLTLYNAYWDAFLSEMQLSEGAMALLEQLREKGLKIGFCTDLTAMIQMRKLCRLGLSDIADAIVTSEESGAEKPSPYPFTLLLEKLRIPPEAAVMIGDDYQKDICGAEQAGIRAIQLGTDCRHALSAPDFNSLSRLLEELCI